MAFISLDEIKYFGREVRYSLPKVKRTLTIYKSCHGYLSTTWFKREKEGWLEVEFDPEAIQLRLRFSDNQSVTTREIKDGTFPLGGGLWTMLRTACPTLKTRINFVFETAAREDGWFYSEAWWLNGSKPE